MIFREVFSGFSGKKVKKGFTGSTAGDKIIIKAAAWRIIVHTGREKIKELLPRGGLYLEVWRYKI